MGPFLFTNLATHTAALAKAQKTGLSFGQIYSLTAAGAGGITTQAVSGSGAVFYVDARVKTIKVTNSGAGAVQCGNASFGSTLPTIISAGTGRGTYKTIAAGATDTFDWNGIAGLFYIGSAGAASSASMEVVDYL